MSINAPIVEVTSARLATVSLLGEANVPADYQEQVKKADRPTAMISVNFASQERLVERAGHV